MTTPDVESTLSDLRRELGAERGGALRVAVITPYCREDEEVLSACHRSVRAQTHPCTHILVADGHPSPIVQSWRAQHIVLPRAHDNLGDSPRAIGSISAVGQGFDAISYLDADNWYDPDHIESMVDLHRRSGAVVCVAARTLNRLDGSLLSAAGEVGDGQIHADTSCLFLTAAAFRIATLWGLVPSAFRAIDDRIVWWAIGALGLLTARRSAPTVHYRTSFRVHYEERGEAPPPGAKGRDHVLRALALWDALPPYERELVNQRLGVRL